MSAGETNTPNNGNGMEQKELRIGVYVCRCGGNISDVIDVERVAEVSKLIPGVTVAKVHTFMCSDPGQKSISEDVQKEHLDRVVVASCSPFLHELTFRGAVMRGGMNQYLYEHVNIREQGSWAHKHNPAGATAKSIRLIAAAVGKVRHSQPLDQIRLPNQRQAMVIGGGIAGMKAAAELAGRGIPVLLVEKSNRLGGHLNRWNQVFPNEQSAGELVDKLRAELRDNALVEVLLNCQIVAVSGFVGNFKITIEGPLGPQGSKISAQVTVGAIVLATGFRPYVPREGEFFYRKHPGVVTMPEFIELMRHNADRPNRLVHEGRDIRSIAFLHCVGSRQVDGVHEPQADGKINNYCSRVCCTTTLQQALTVRNRYPHIQVYDLHQDIRTYGRGHEDYYINACKSGVLFFRYHGDEPPQVELATPQGGKDEPLRVTFKDYLTWGQELALKVDMVVLAVGMTAGDIKPLIDMFKLPVGEDRFIQETHPKLRPVEISINGVLLGGTVQAPMNIQETLNAAGAAAVKVSSMFLKKAVELNPYVAEVDTRLCEGTGACITQCEYDGALAMMETQENGRTVRKAHVNPGLCVGCGACVAVCPNQAINVNGWRIDQYDAMVDGLVADIPGLAPAAVS